jgi:outer membrane protein
LQLINKELVAAENALFLSKLSMAQLLQLDDFKDFDIADENVAVPVKPSATMAQKHQKHIIAESKTRTV